MLKVALPDDESTWEAAVLTAADGGGYARVLAAAPEHRAVLLEHLGRALDGLGLAPGAQIATLCAVLRAAWAAPAPPGVPIRPKAEELAELVTRLWDDLGRPCSARVVDAALECARRRAVGGDAGRVVVVHGDPHPGNTLRVPHPRPGAEAGFVLVDPVGFVADPAYDLGVVLRDWCPELLAAADAPALVERYVGLLSAGTGVDANAIREWGFLERVSTGLYILECGTERDALPFLETAERLVGGGEGLTLSSRCSR